MADEDVAEGAGEAEEYIEAGEGPQQVPGEALGAHAGLQPGQLRGGREAGEGAVLWGSSD